MTAIFPLVFELSIEPKKCPISHVLGVTGKNFANAIAPLLFTQKNGGCFKFATNLSPTYIYAKDVNDQVMALGIPKYITRIKEMRIQNLMNIPFKDFHECINTGCLRRLRVNSFRTVNKTLIIPNLDYFHYNSCFINGKDQKFVMPGVYGSIEIFLGLFSKIDAEVLGTIFKDTKYCDNFRLFIRGDFRKGLDLSFVVSSVKIDARGSDPCVYLGNLVLNSRLKLLSIKTHKCKKINPPIDYSTTKLEIEMIDMAQGEIQEIEINKLFENRDVGIRTIHMGALKIFNSASKNFIINIHERTVFDLYFDTRPNSIKLNKRGKLINIYYMDTGAIKTLNGQ